MAAPLSKGRWGAPAPLLLLALALLYAAISAAEAQNSTATGNATTAAGAASCWSTSHFVVTGGLAACKSRCAARLTAAGKGSVWPELYKPSSSSATICCRCQYRNPPVEGDPTPASRSTSDGPTSTGSAVDPGDAADDDPVQTDADLAQQQADAAAGKTKKKSGRVWWKFTIVAGGLCLIIAVTSAALIWDCCKCRRRGHKDEVAEVRDAVRDTMAKQMGKRGDKHRQGSQKLSEAAQKRLAALDLALEMRETKLEAQQAARFEVVVNAAAPPSPSAPSAAAADAGTSTSVPTSPARSRVQRMRTAINPFA